MISHPGGDETLALISSLIVLFVSFGHTVLVWEEFYFQIKKTEIQVDTFKVNMQTNSVHTTRDNQFCREIIAGRITSTCYFL